MTQALSAISYVNPSVFTPVTQSSALSFGEILSNLKGQSTAGEIKNLLNVQKGVYETHIRVELVSKVADGALSTVRRLQQGQ